MSKLAPAPAGQSTQGIGTVPSDVRAVPRASSTQQYPSPLQAQRAEAEDMVGFLESANHNDPDSDSNQGHGEPTAPPPINPRSAHSAAAATVTAAWLSLTATELEVRKYFKSLAVPSGLEMLAKMRKQCDLAAETLQQRMDEGNQERCTGCDKTLEEVHKSQWIMMGSDMDADTGVPVPYRFCGPLCVRERNRKNMLPKELRDQKRFDGADIAEVR